MRALFMIGVASRYHRRVEMRARHVVGVAMLIAGAIAACVPVRTARVGPFVTKIEVKDQGILVERCGMQSVRDDATPANVLLLMLGILSMGRSGGAVEDGHRVERGRCVLERFVVSKTPTASGRGPGARQ